MTLFHTIGHSNHPIDKLLGLLVAAAVTTVADVRSRPVSRRNPQFNGERLAGALRDRDIAYIFLGEELGARPQDPGCYDASGTVQYRRLAAGEPFKSGIARLLAGAQTQRIALLCAEKEPLDCHRTLLVGRALEAKGAHVAHILADGVIESNESAMARLVKLTRLRGGEDLFMDAAARVEAACALREAKIAYHKKSGPRRSALDRQ